MQAKGKDEPTHLQDVIVETQLREARDAFIQSIRPDDVRQLAASYHSSQHPGEFFQEPIRGSYNICYFVRFPSSVPGQWDNWVVRIPLTPYLPFGVGRKLQGEVAAMRLGQPQSHASLPVSRK
jgi:hypothetical protein